MLEMYARNTWLVRPGPEDDLKPVTPWSAATGQIGEATEGALVTVTGRVTQLEPDAFWIDDGSGAARVFFSAFTGLTRPQVHRDERWSVTGVVVEFTTVRDTAPRYRLQVRFASDVSQLTNRGGSPRPTETPRPADVAPTLTETEEPTATPEP